MRRCLVKLSVLLLGAKGGFYKSIAQKMRLFYSFTGIFPPLTPPEEGKYFNQLIV